MYALLNKNAELQKGDILMAKSLRNSIRNITGTLLFVCVIFGQWTLAGSGGPYVLEWTTIDGGGTSSGVQSVRRNI